MRTHLTIPLKGFLKSILIFSGSLFSLPGFAVVTFREVNERIFTPICADCHSGSKPSAKLDLQNFDSIMRKGVVVPKKPEESRLFERVVTGEMPAGGDPLNEEQIQLIKSWILDGALNSTPSLSIVLKSVNPRFGPVTGGFMLEVEGENFLNGVAIKINEEPCVDLTLVSQTLLTCVVPKASGAGKVPVSAEFEGVKVVLMSAFEYRVPLGPYYSAIFSNIIKTRCLGCHSGESPEKELDLSTYESLMSYPRAVVPYRAKKSRLYKKILAGEMPFGGPPLSSDEVRAVADWINLGSKED